MTAGSSVSSPFSLSKPAAKGWCPTARKPMESGDGWIMRLRFPLAVLSFSQAETIAALARAYGNGWIDLTSRANLQIRGVSDEKLSTLQDVLEAEGLIGPEDDAPPILLSPLSGIDPGCLDWRPAASEAARRLSGLGNGLELPAKFLIAFDGGGSWPLRETGADILIDAAGLKVQERLRRGLSIEARMAVESILREILAQKQPKERVAVSHTPRNGSTMPGIGLVKFDDNRCMLGIGAAYGRLSGESLAALVAAARGCGATAFRLTPWRSLIATGDAASDLASLVDQAAKLGFVTRPDDSRRLIAACTGKPACMSASVETRALADAITARLPVLSGSDIALHVSGCAKGCAHPRRADWTVTGEAGHYHLIAANEASGMPLLSGLSPEGVLDAILTRLHERSHV